jgi:hypothetical protein
MEILTVSDRLCVRLLECFASTVRKTPLQSNHMLVPYLPERHGESRIYHRVSSKVDMHTIWSLAMISLVEIQHMMAFSTCRQDRLKRDFQSSDARSMLEVHCYHDLRRESTHLLQHVQPMALLYGDLFDTCVLFQRHCEDDMSNVREHSQLKGIYLLMRVCNRS